MSVRPLFSSLLLVVTVAGALCAGPASARGAAAETTGLWETAWGALQMWEKGDRVQGVYPVAEGKIEGEYNPRTRELSGFWMQNGGAPRCDKAVQGSYYWGSFVFVFDKSGHAFEGQWSSCGAALGGAWNGSR